jgi:predicted GIY-YIG superfamily endonuclease
MAIASHITITQAMFDPEEYHSWVPEKLKYYQCDDEYDPFGEYDGWRFTENGGTIYLLQSENGNIKIGKSSDLAKRIETHRGSNPFTRLIAYEDTRYASQCETILHQICSDYKIEGTREWFSPDCKGLLDKYFNLFKERTVADAAIIKLWEEDFDPYLDEDFIGVCEDDYGNEHHYTKEDYERDCIHNEKVRQKINDLLSGQETTANKFDAFTSAWSLPR